MRKKFWLKKTEEKNGIPVNDNTMVELANLCEYLKLDFASYFKGYELPKRQQILLRQLLINLEVNHMDYAKESLRLHKEWKGKIQVVTKCAGRNTR